MIFDIVRLAPDDVDAAAIGHPSGFSGSEALVRVGDAFVVFFFVFVFDGVRSGITTEPELFDELLALFIGRQPFESGAFFISNDVGGVFLQPFLHGLANFVGLGLGFLLIGLGWRFQLIFFLLAGLAKND